MARVLVDKGVLHLDRYFDYAVPEELDEQAQPGVRVRVRFGAGAHQVREGRREGGGLRDGFIVERLAESDYQGPLAALAQVISPERVLDPGCSSSLLTPAFLPNATDIRRRPRHSRRGPPPRTGRGPVPREGHRASA